MRQRGCGQICIKLAIFGHPAVERFSVSSRQYILIVILSFVLGMQISAAAQQPSAKPSPLATPHNEQQEPVKVFTEEVRLPVVALDQYSHYDPTLEPDDILVLEDGVPQQIR